MKRHRVIALVSLGVVLSAFAWYTVHLKLANVPRLRSASTTPERPTWPLSFHRQLSNAEKQHVLDAPFAVVTSINGIPQEARRAFATITGEHEFSLANPGQKYQVTDVIEEPGLPFRRLLFAGVNADKWFVHYEHGGIGHGYSVVVFQLEPGKRVHFLWGGAGFHGAKDLPELRQMVAAGQFSDVLPYYW